MLKLMSFVLKSKQRLIILRYLSNPKTPTQISDETKLAVSHISRTLKEFNKKGVAECLTPKEKTGRIYQLTKKGKQVLDKISKK